MKRFFRFAFLLAVTWLLAACSGQANVKIGVVAPMSGALAQYGKDIAQGAQVAVDELNANRFMINGQRAHFELVVEDDKASPEEGKAAAKRLIDAHVAAVFGHFNSGVSIPAAPLYAAAGIPQLSVSTNAKYTRSGWKTAFRITADDVQQGNTLGRLITDKLHAKSIYLVDDTTTFGIGLVDEVVKVLKSKKLEAPHDSVDIKTANYPALVQKIKDSKADVVFFGGDQAVGLPLLKELRKEGSSAQFVVGDAMCDASVVKAAGGDADSNFHCTIAGVPPSWLSAGIGFAQAYNAKYKAPPGTYSTLAYDGINILAEAMQEANSSVPAEYMPVMAKGTFDGKVQGMVEFDEKGDLKDGTVVIYRAIGGQLTEQRDLF